MRSTRSNSVTSYNLGRFVAAQAPVYRQVLAELAAGRKRTHWMWFVFPQIAGLGTSATARTYAISCIEEAQAFLADPVLGPRLCECTSLVVACGSSDVHAIFGTPDDLKFHSSLTLFAMVAGPDPCFTGALSLFFGGEGDQRTLDLLGREWASDP